MEKSNPDLNGTEKDLIIGKLFFSKYKAIKKLGEGSFGKVYKAEFNGEEFAIKMEEKSKENGLLEMEATIMSYLKGPNIPKIYSFGYSGSYNILIMQLLDKSLEDLINLYNTFSIKTSAMLGYQMMSIMQYIHDRHIIHRDIKPDNFVMGANENNALLYILDFGLAKKYRSSRTLMQYPYIKRNKLTGTARYASIHALGAYEQSRRDDLESIGYVLMYFLRGNLPWQGLKARSKEDRYKKILDKKKETSSEELCRNFPKEFCAYVNYTKNLEYEDNPDYDMLKQLFLDVIKKAREKLDYVYDWTSYDDLQKRKIIKKNKDIDDGKFKRRTSKNSKSSKNSKIKDEENASTNNKQTNKKNLNIYFREKEKEYEREGKVESICCIMYVYIIYKLYFIL